MPFSGNLGTFSLPNVLQLLNRESVSGVLNILDAGIRLRIYFEKGEIVFASGIGKEAQLIQIMGRKGLLTPAQQAEARRFLPDDRFQLGPYLLKNRLIPEATWNRFVRFLVDQTLLKAFLLEQADFRFEEGGIPVPPVYKVQVNLMQLILDITRKMDEWNFLRKGIPDGQIVFYVNDVPENQERTLHFNRSEWSVLSKIDGKRTVEEIVQECELDELSVYKILYSFMSSGLIRRVENVYLNRQGDFIDYEGILTLYMDLIRIVERNLKQDVGVQFYAIYERCLATVNRKSEGLLEEFSPFSGESGELVQHILKRMGRYPNFREGKKALLSLLNELLRSLLREMEGIVGRKITEATIQELIMAVSFVGKYHANSDIKRFVLDALTEGGSS